MLLGMQQTTDAPAGGIEIAKRPAGKADDGPLVRAVLKKAATIVAEFPSQTGDIIKMIIMGRTDGGAAAKT